MKIHPITSPALEQALGVLSANLESTGRIPFQNTGRSGTASSGHGVAISAAIENLKAAVQAAGLEPEPSFEFDILAAAVSSCSNP